MNLSIAAVEALLPQYMYTFFRLSGLVLSMPIIGTKLIPNRIKIIFLISLTIIIAPLLPAVDIEPFTTKGFIVAILQVVIGITIGLILHIIFETFVLCGQLVAQQMGLGFANMMDPSKGVSVPAVGQLYVMMVTLIFLGVGGHLMVIEAIAHSFKSIPIGLNFLNAPDGVHLIYWGGWMFTVALQITLPAITALFLVNIGFGVMTKAAPQINIFSIGFPATMLGGIVIIGLTLTLILPGFNMIFEMVFDLIHEMLGVSYE